MSISFTIPDLRITALSSGVNTVPFGEIWLIKSFSDITTPGTSISTVVINGNSYNFSHNYSSSWTYHWNNLSTYWPSKLILKGGDTITASSTTLSVVYWRLETDFNIDINKIPNLRQVTASTSSIGSYVNLITVPANQTWIVKFAIINNAYTGSSNVETTLRIVNGGTTFYPYDIKTNSVAFTTNSHILYESIILKTGDTIDVKHFNLNFTTSLTLGYWILETDF